MGTDNRLWNRNFSILWQGQLISDLGNGIFMFILGFWILDLTNKNTFLYGTVLTCLSVPRVLFGPFAGTFADRHSRKWIIVFADLFRGVLFVCVGLAALRMGEAFPVYVLFPTAVISGLCSAFFSPALISSIPDIVPLDKLTKANSLRTFSQSCSSFVGYALGGVLLSLVHAPKIVFGYGCCFLYAAVTQFFMHIPMHAKAEKKHILHDMVEGLKFTFRQAGIRTLIITGMFLNFFVMMGLMLLTPLFEETPGYGRLMLGFVMGTMMVGQLVGMLLISFIKFSSKDRPKIFYSSIAVLIGCMIPVGLVNNVHVMFPIAFFIGVAVAVMVTLMYTLVQVTVPSVNRGRVFGVMSTVFEGLNPVAPMLAGGIAAILTVRTTLVSAFACAALVLAYAFFNRPFRAYMKSEPLQENGGEAPAAPEEEFPRI